MPLRYQFSLGSTARIISKISFGCRRPIEAAVNYTKYYIDASKRKWPTVTQVECTQALLWQWLPTTHKLRPKQRNQKKGRRVVVRKRVRHSRGEEGICVRSLVRVIYMENCNDTRRWLLVLSTHTSLVWLQEAKIHTHRSLPEQKKIIQCARIRPPSLRWPH